MRWIIPLLIALAPSVVAQGQAPPAEIPALEARTVTVTAEGYNKDDALKRTLRMALEQGAGVQIASFSQAENFALLRDTIYSRAAGIVTDYRILEEREGAGGTVIVKIEAVVRPDAVAQTWGEVQNVLDQIGRPRIMVWIDERIDGRLESDSIVAARIEELFTKAGFDLVAKDAIDEIRRKAREEAETEQNAAKLAQLAKSSGAHILIRGSANANRAGVENLYGVLAAFYNCDVQARVYYTDTGRLIASESLPETRSGVRSQKEFSPQAARSALVRATFPEADSPAMRPPLANRLYEAVMSQWSTQITAGGDIELEIQGLDFRGYARIKKALEEKEHVKRVDGDFSKGIGTFRIKADLSAENLALQLTEAPFAELLEVTDLQLNRITAQAVK